MFTKSDVGIPIVYRLQKAVKNPHEFNVNTYEQDFLSPEHPNLNELDQTQYTEDTLFSTDQNKR